VPIIFAGNFTAIQRGSWPVDAGTEFVLEMGGNFELEFGDGNLDPAV